MTLGSGFQTFPPPPRPPTLVDEFSGSCRETARRNSPADLKHTQPPSRKQDRPDETRKTVMHLTLQSLRHSTVPRLAPVCPTLRLVVCRPAVSCHSWYHSFVRSFVRSFIQSFSSVTQHARHAHAQVTRETHHKRCTTSHLFSSAVPPTFAPPPPLCFVVGSFVYVTMPLSAQSSSSSVARDVLWARVFGALPDELRTALCSAGLDDPRVLCEYPVESWQNVEEIMGGQD